MSSTDETTETRDEAARRQAQIDAASAQKAQRRFRPGAQDESDPDWMYAETKPEQTKEWIDTLAPALGAQRTASGRGGGAGPLFSEWERDFHKSIAMQFEENTKKGLLKPLTGKQLVVLAHMLKKLAADTAAKLEAGHGDDARR